MKTALVTGSAGFAGRHYVRALEERGCRVTQCDPEMRPLILPDDDALHFFEHNDTRFDLVIHCAAHVGGRADIDGFPMSQVVNLQLDAALFRWAMKTRPGRLVYISSSAAYPVNVQTLSLKLPMGEWRIDPSFNPQASIGVPDQLYGWAKLTGENLAYRAREAGLKVSVIRPFSGYGEDQDPAYPFRAFAERAKRRAEPFEIWGNAFQCRDFIHIDDIVEATMVMTEQGIDGPVNLGTGIPTALGDLAALFCVRAGYTPKFEVNLDAPMGVGYRVADVTKMNEFYTAKVSLEEGVRRALDA